MHTQFIYVSVSLVTNNIILFTPAERKKYKQAKEYFLLTQLCVVRLVITVSSVRAYPL